MRLRHAFFSLTGITLALLVAFAAWLDIAVRSEGPLKQAKLVYIAPGLNTREIGDKLESEGIIRHRHAFVVEAYWQKRRAPLKAGEYQFAPDTSIAGAVALLQSGKTWQRQITVPEGLTSFEITAMLREDASLKGEAAIPPEGSLLPETYNFSYGDSRASIIARMQKSMTETVEKLWPGRANDLPFTTKEEAVTLASIVEKETGVAAERPLVAGVFINRLKKKIPLQSDPTVIYAATMGKEKFDRAIFQSDLKRQSPYNTYAVPGLPPAPIANPGSASIAAVLNPEKHDYIYFVANGTGGHVFAKTLAEHNANVAKWRKIEAKKAAPQ